MGPSPKAAAVALPGSTAVGDAGHTDPVGSDGRWSGRASRLAQIAGSIVGSRTLPTASVRIAAGVALGAITRAGAHADSSRATSAMRRMASRVSPVAKKQEGGRLAPPAFTPLG